MEIADLHDLARRYALAKEEADVLDTRAKAAKRHKDELEDELWFELERAKLPNPTFEDCPRPGLTLQLQRRETRRARILDYEAAAAALRDMGLDDEILEDQRKVRQQRLNQEVNERLENGDELPAGVDFTSTRFVSVSYK
jgi:hypothetical protein